MTPDKFVFHISDPNNEDVEPIAEFNWLAVADGMGGSGCMKHEVREKDRDSLSRILEYVLPEYKSLKNEQDEPLFDNFVGEDPKTSYLARIFAPCVCDAVNTSARWASRIIMTRFLYYISTNKFDPNDRKEVDALCAFLKQGLERTAATISLTVSDPNMSLLPTTFAALHYRPLPGKEYEVHALWAGDSRCYLLNQDGLAKLSADDEDKFKQLTNAFTADGHTELHSRRYVLKKPFVLFCASDGFFDAYDKYELSVEARLLNDIFEAKTLDELRERLVNRYTCNVADDTSVALVGVGFLEYGELQSMLVNRWKRVKALYEQHCNYAYIASLISRPEHLATGTVCDRFESKFTEIVRRIVLAGFKGQNDPLVTPQWKQRISDCEARKAEEIRSRVNERKTELRRNVLSEIRNSDYAFCFGGRRDFDNPTWGKALKGYYDAKCAQREVLEAERRLEKEGKSLENERASLLSRLHDNMYRTCCEFQNELRGDIETSGQKQPEDIAKDHLNCCKWLTFLARCERSLLKGEDFHNKEPIGERGKQLQKEIRTYNNNRHWHEVDSSNTGNQRKKWEKDLDSALLKLEPYIGEMLECRNTVFTTQFIEKLKINEIMSCVINREELLDAVTNEMIANFAKDTGILRETLEAWKKITDQTTCIDDLFAAGRLSDFRKYYRNRTLSDSEEFRRYMEDLDQIESEYGRLLV